MSREQDARVAKILGVRVGRVPRYVSRDGYTICIEDPEGDYDCPRFTSDPAADYKVLEWVREKYQVGPERNIHILSAFQNALLKALYARADSINREYEYFLMWQPGDYSRALLELDRQGFLLNSTSSSENGNQ